MIILRSGVYILFSHNDSIYVRGGATDYRVGCVISATKIIYQKDVDSSSCDLGALQERPRRQSSGNLFG